MNQRPAGAMAIRFAQTLADEKPQGNPPVLAVQNIV